MDEALALDAARQAAQVGAELTPEQAAALERYEELHLDALYLRFWDLCPDWVKRDLITLGETGGGPVNPDQAPPGYERLHNFIVWVFGIDPHKT